MATDIYSMLTGGADPRADYMKQQQAFQQRLSQATDPRAFIATVGSNVGGMLGQGIGNFIGGNDEENKIKQILQQVGNITNPLDQAKAAYKLFSDAGMAKQAQIMMERIRQLGEEDVNLKYKQAQTSYYENRGTGTGKGTGPERMIQYIGDVRKRLLQNEDVPEWEITQANDYIEYLGKQKSYVDKDGNVITVSQSQISPLPTKKAGTPAPVVEETPRSAGAGRGFVNPPLIGATPSPVTETKPAPTGTLPPGSGARITTTPAGAKTAEQAKAKTQLQAKQAKNVTATVDEALGLVSGWTAGIGSLLASVPGSSAIDLEGALETIKANLGFDRLQQMRDASPTGGALGQVAVQELEALQATVASLKQGQSPEKLRSGLKKVKQHYENWLQVMQGNNPYKASEVPPPATFKGSKADQALINKYLKR